ncbi:ligand-binding sensor domain-containing protein [Runella zeae]|uniref:ligand-binding sensor domain-containing protein n=1 Tax=Runella zeae TaxID=94255 RepID=UPI0004014A65|nr:sensor histidine kinase [Runella zeae]
MKKYLWLLVWIASRVVMAHTTTPITDYWDHLALNEGLSQNEIRSIVQDHRGMMWFGTQDGLNCYDGQSIKKYRHNPFDSTTITHDDITFLYEDSAHHLWVGTTKGLNRKLAQKNIFQNFPQIEGIVTHILEDKNHTIWVGTSAGLWVLRPKNNDFQYFLYRHNLDDASSLSHDFVGSMALDSEGSLWIGTAKGLNKVLAGSVLRFENARNSSLPLYQKEHLPTHVWNAKGRGVWVSTPKQFGLLNIQVGEIDDFTSALPADVVVSSVCTDHLGVVWVGTQGKGIYRFRFNKITRQLLRVGAYQEDLLAKNGLKSSHITCIYEGNEPQEDIVWVGTREAGVQLYARSKNTFRHWERLLKQETAAGKSFFGIGTDKEGFLWAGTFANLYRINRRTQAIRKYELTKNALIETIAEDAKGTLWMGGNVGLLRYDRLRDRFAAFPLPTFDNVRPWVFRIYNDSSHQMWIGTRSYLAKIDAEGKTQVIREIAAPKNTKIELRNIGAIQKDAKGGLWIGMRQGLVHWPDEATEAQLFQNNPRDPKSLIDNVVLDIHVDSKQRVWICTTKGLSRVINEKGKITFEHFTEKEGLSNSFVYGALSDSKGKMWLTTNGGIVCFDPDRHTFRNYTAKDGLGGAEFNSGGFHQSAEGELFFGGNGMLLSCWPNEIIPNRHLAKVAVTSFKKFEKEWDIDSLLASQQPISFEPDENFFSFDLAALDFTNPSQNQFAYRLEGFHKDWILAGTRRYLSFTNLNPGHYTLHLKAANNEGLWNDKDVLSIPLYIQPPFWQTWWFYVVVILILATAIKVFYDYRVRMRVKYLFDLERVKLEENERVRKLAAQDLHDEFGNTLTRISLLTEIIKTRLNGQANGEIGMMLTKIGDNSNRMYQGTKDFIWAINPEHDNFYEIAVRLKDFGDDAFDKTGIRFSVEGLNDDLRSVNLYMGESRHLVLLFKEAISNTLKHAQAREVKLRFGFEKGEMTIEWYDDGKGFEIDQVRQGNGLTNIHTRAQKIGGMVVIDSLQKKGTCVRFRKKINEEARK